MDGGDAEEIRLGVPRRAEAGCRMSSPQPGGTAECLARSPPPSPGLDYADPGLRLRGSADSVRPGAVPSWFRDVRSGVPGGL